jgi:hypothetical protein
MVSLTAGAALLYEIIHWRPAGPLRFTLLAALAIAASRLRVKLPGINGVMAMNLPFLLIVIAELGMPEALVLAFLCGITQSFSRSADVRPLRMLFSSATLVNAAALGGVIFASLQKANVTLPLAVIAAAAGYFVANTVLMAIVLWLAESKNPLLTWTRMAQLSLPCYMLSAAMAAILCCGLRNLAWSATLSLFAATFMIYRSYRMYFAPSPPAATPAAN